MEKIKKASRHIRYNIEITPEEDQSRRCMRIHLAVVDSDNLMSLHSLAVNSLSNYGSLDDSQTGVSKTRGRVGDSEFKYYFHSYDIDFRASQAKDALENLGVKVIEDRRLAELRGRYKHNQFCDDQTSRSLADRVKQLYEK